MGAGVLCRHCIAIIASLQLSYTGARPFELTRNPFAAGMLLFLAHPNVPLSRVVCALFDGT